MRKRATFSVFAAVLVALMVLPVFATQESNQVVNLVEIGAPITPNTLIISLYAANDGGTTRLYFKDDAGLVSEIATFDSAGAIINLGSDPADGTGGGINLSNDDEIAFEASAAGTDVVAMSVDSSEVVQIAPSGASGVTITPALTVTGDSLLGAQLALTNYDTFTDSDATPDVSDTSFYQTNTTTYTLTDFDGSDIRSGQIIYVVSKGAITYDVTGTGLKGGTTDLITASGDLTAWIYDGTDWILLYFMDMSDNLA